MPSVPRLFSRTLLLRLESFELQNALCKVHESILQSPGPVGTARERPLLLAGLPSPPEPGWGGHCSTTRESKEKNAHDVLRLC